MVKQRRDERLKAEKKMVVMKPVFSSVFKTSLMLPASHGKGVQILKEGSKPRRTKAEILAEK